MQSGCEDTLEEWYAIKFCFKLRKNATETYGMLQTAFQPSCILVVMEGLPFLGLVWFYGILTIVGYLMPIPFYTYIKYMISKHILR